MMRYRDGNLFKQLDKQQLEIYQERYNRSVNQANWLYTLCGGNFKRLLLLEEKIKEHNIAYCPDSAEQCEEIINRVKVVHVKQKTMVGEHGDKIRALRAKRNNPEKKSFFFKLLVYLRTFCTFVLLKLKKLIREMLGR